MIVLTVLLWVVVLARIRSLLYSSADRAQWATLFAFAVSLTIGDNLAFCDRVLGVANIALVLVHLSAVLGAAAQLEFIERVANGGSACCAPRWRPAHTFTAVVCALIITAAGVNRQPETLTIAATYGGTFEAAAGRVLMLLHLGVVAVLLCRLCWRARRAAADPPLRAGLTLMWAGAGAGLVYASCEGFITVALWRRKDLGGFITGHMRPLDQGLIAAAFATYALGCVIPGASLALGQVVQRRRAARIVPVWEAVCAVRPEYSIADDMEGLRRLYLLRLVLELAEERRRLAVLLPDDALDRARFLLGGRVRQRQLDPAAHAAVLRAGLAACETGCAERALGVETGGVVIAARDADSATRWWARVGRVWSLPQVAETARDLGRVRSDSRG